MSNLTFMFNNGNGTVLCNGCHIMLVQTANRDHQIDCAHLCDACFDDFGAQKALLQLWAQSYTMDERDKYHLQIQTLKYLKGDYDVRED